MRWKWKKQCPVIEHTGEPCAWLASEEVTMVNNLQTFRLRTCHWHAGLLTESTVERPNKPPRPWGKADA